MTKPPGKADCAHHGRVPRHRPRLGHRAGQVRARHVICTARTVGGLEETERRDPAKPAAPPPLVPMNLRDFDAIDRSGRLDL